MIQGLRERGLDTWGFALAVGLLTAWGVTGWVDRQLTHHELEGLQSEAVEVTVAAKTLEAGQPLQESDLRLASLPAALLPPPEQRFSTVDEALGRTPRERILEGEVLRRERIAQQGAGSGLSAILRPGRRAMVITPSEDAALTRQLRPGHRIDLLVLEPDSAPWVAMEDLAVLSIAEGLEGDPPSLTLELTPEEALELSALRAESSLHVALRSELQGPRPRATAKTAEGKRDRAAAKPAPRGERPADASEAPPEEPKPSIWDQAEE